jgi:hypothetical protein
MTPLSPTASRPRSLCALRRAFATYHVAVWIASFCGVAHAQLPEHDAERAEHFFVEGRSAMKMRRYEEACAKFSESQQLEPASGTLLNLAVCREAQGRTATAWTHYAAGLALSQTEGNAEGERFAQERLRALEPVLYWLTIEPPKAGRAELVIMLDGAKLEREKWGSALPVDPGAHVVVASAPQRKLWMARISLVEQGARHLLRVPSLAIIEPAASVRKPPTARADRTGFRWDVGLSGAVGVMGIAGTGYFGTRAKSEWDTRNEHCPNGVCDDKAVDASERSRTFARIANVSAAVGIVGAGVAFYFIAFPAQKPRATSLPLNVRVTRHHADVTVGGRF